MGFDFSEKMNIDPALGNIGWNLRIPAFGAIKIALCLRKL